MLIKELFGEDEVIKKLFAEKVMSRRIEFLNGFSKDLPPELGERWIKSIEEVEICVSNVFNFPRKKIVVKEVYVDEKIEEGALTIRNTGLKLIADGEPEYPYIFYDPGFLKVRLKEDSWEVVRWVKKSIVGVCCIKYYDLSDSLEKSFWKLEGTLFNNKMLQSYNYVEKTEKNRIFSDLNENFQKIAPYTILEIMGNQMANEYLISLGGPGTKNLLERIRKYYTAYSKISYAPPENKRRIEGKVLAAFYLSGRTKKLETKKILEMEVSELEDWIYNNIAERFLRKLK